MSNRRCSTASVSFLEHATFTVRARSSWHTVTEEERTVSGVCLHDRLLLQIIPNTCLEDRMPESPL